MTTNGEKQASPKHPRVTDHIASAKRRRFRRLKSAPLADSFTYDKKTDAVKQCPKSVFDQFSPSYWKIGVVLLVYLAAGTLCFHLTRHQIAGNKTNSVLDALYFTVVTMTSVGYGDVIPDSTLTILLACLFVVLGMLIVGLVLGKAAEVLVVKQERILEKALHLHETIGEAQILKKMKTNTARNKCIILVLLLLVLMGAGTGLGYIHTCFTTTGSRVFAVFWILLGTVYVAQLLFTFALLYSERKQRSLVKWVLKRKTTTSDLEAADFDGDGVVVAAEFVLYKLKEMGKISQDDITPIVDEFETLDFDKTGTLSVNDLRLSQSALLSGADIVAPRLSV
ncbi:putative EF-hand domain pair, potassium channel domain, EF-Hand 1, calcium-binding protein [Helianthus annuus]|nr:putative EF-hand domain pair, potassium channel domain, EF-Hand 1, calcium-binding protein [Helianthus annuus]